MSTTIMNQDDPTTGGSVERSRPTTEASYGIPESTDGMLGWEFVEARLAADRCYWVVTIRPDGKPHARPTWGVWVDGALYCGGGEQTRWVRNLTVRPDIVVHGGDAEDVVILEGTAERIDDETAPTSRIEQIDRAYEKKYDVRHGTPFFTVRPDVVFAWSDYPTDATRWEFPEQ